MVFPSDAEVRVSTRTLKPADGAISSLSIESNRAMLYYDGHPLTSISAGRSL